MGGIPKPRQERMSINLKRFLKRIFLVLSGLPKGLWNYCKMQKNQEL